MGPVIIKWVHLGIFRSFDLANYGLKPAYYRSCSYNGSDGQWTVGKYLKIDITWKTMLFYLNKMRIGKEVMLFCDKCLVYGGFALTFWAAGIECRRYHEDGVIELGKGLKEKFAHLSDRNDLHTNVLGCRLKWFTLLP
jgi:hypothetical protein